MSELTIGHASPLDGKAIAETESIHSLIARINKLEAENFALAAGACPFTDGSGLIGDDYGNPVCLKDKRIKEQERLIKLTVDDLRMRSEDGVVNISDFIWQKLKEAIK